jgi:hypothetical protein
VFVEAKVGLRVEVERGEAVVARAEAARGDVAVPQVLDRLVEVREHAADRAVEGLGPRPIRAPLRVV